MVGTLPTGMLHRPLLPLAAVALIAVAGCAGTSTNKDSTDKFKGDQRLVANAVEDFESAASKGDQSKVCRESLAKALVAQYAQRGGTCERAVDAALKDTDSFGLTVESVAIDGTSATARVKADRGDHDVMQTIGLVKQGQDWRISRFG
jgi:hypothetical protein